ncbi:hypothetical protein D9M68_840820 [compost metagenome]
MGERRCRAGRALSGSRTPTTIRPTETSAGSTANQSTRSISPASRLISRMASSGPRKAPTVSMAWRRPKLAPRISAGVISATRASLGAPRMPLPMRSSRRAKSTWSTEPARGNSGLLSAASP